MIKFLKTNNIFAFIAIILFSFFATFPLFHKGFFVTDDGDWMIIRFTAFHQAFRDGEIPVRFLGRLAQEYGYPVTNFLYPGYLYLAELFHLFHFGFINSIKMLLLLSMIFSAVFVFLWLRTFFSSITACIGTLYYLLAPYHFYDLYKRGSVGEVLALAVLPFILWQIDRKSLFWSSIGIGILLISHNTLALLFTGLIFLYLVCKSHADKRNSMYKYLLMLLFGIGLAAFFWIPALLDLHLTVFGDTHISDFSGYFSTFSLTGYATYLILIGAGVLLLIKKKILGNKRYIALFGLIAVLSVFFASSVSSPIWHILPVAFIQFPFRLLSLTIIGGAFLIPYCLSMTGKKVQILSACIIVALMLLTDIPMIKDIQYTDKDDSYYATNLATTTVMDEYMPVWVKEKPLSKHEKTVVLLSGKGNINTIVNTTNKITFTTELVSLSKIQINTIYWPGWNVLVDAKQVPVTYNNSRGLITISVPPGRHTVAADFTETTQDLIADCISIFSFIALIFVAVVLKKKKKDHAKF